MAQGKVYSLKCLTQNYLWGKIGKDSTVALLGLTQDGFEFNPELPYAELWMGAHIKAPSIVKNTNPQTNLIELINKNPSLLGENVIKRFPTASLPYLFKVLSVNKSLSIQIHPDKKNAEEMHVNRPDIYTDDNHKPEIAIATSPFEALCGFRPAAEILNFFHEVEELLQVVGQDAVDTLINAEMATEKSLKEEAVRRSVKGCLTRLMKCDEKVVKEQLDKLVNRLNDCHEKKEDTSIYQGRLFLRVHSEYPGDVGCFMIYFLNYIQLEPYESIYFGSGVPHAYLKGDIIECMANSNNVVRAGLTQKYRDVDTFISMVEYKCQTVNEMKFIPKTSEEDPCVCIYNPPVDDFSVKKIQIPRGQKPEYNVKSIDGPSILLTLSGHADLTYKNASRPLPISRGSVLFIGSGEDVKLTNIASDEEVLMFQAYCDLA